MAWLDKIQWMLPIASWGEGDNPSNSTSRAIPIYRGGQSLSGAETALIESFTAGNGLRAKTGGDFAHVKFTNGAAGNFRLQNQLMRAADQSNLTLGFWVDIASLPTTQYLGYYRYVPGVDERLNHAVTTSGILATYASNDWATPASRIQTLSYSDTDPSGRYITTGLQLIIVRLSPFDASTSNWDIFRNGSNLISNTSTYTYWNMGTTDFDNVDYYIGNNQTAAGALSGKIYCAFAANTLTVGEMDEIYAAGPTLGLTAVAEGATLRFLDGALETGSFRGSLFSRKKFRGGKYKLKAFR